MINKLIINALKELGVPVYYLTRGENSGTCIVFNYIKSPLYADDGTDMHEYNIILNIYTTAEHLMTTIDGVMGAMCNHGFVELPSPIARWDDVLQMYNQPLQFKFYK